MPRKKAAAKTTKSTKNVTKVTKSSNPNFFEYLRFGESYTSLVLGIIAVIIATILLLSLVNNRQSQKPDSNVVPTVVDVKDLGITVTPTPQPGQVTVEKAHVVVSGESLWDIAEKAYGNGDNWVDIAKANKLEDPGNIHVGDKLNLPSLSVVAAKPAIETTPAAMEKPAVEEKGTVITGENEAAVSRTKRVVSNTYTVVHGDDLWDIAVRAYGDGYQWTKIAQANHLENPNVIHAGNVLQLPRN